MRKYIALTLTVLCLLTFSSCKDEKTQSSNTPSNSSSNVESLHNDDSTDNSDVTSSDDTSSDDTERIDDSSSSKLVPVVNNDKQDSSKEGENFVEIKPLKNSADLLDPQKGGTDAVAQKMRNSILSSKDELKITGQKYYVSPNGDDENDGLTPSTAWKTIGAVVSNSYNLVAGDGVLFERNGIYRTGSPFVLESGVTYGAYGSGDKPAIYGSVLNYAQGYYWTPSNKKYIWKVNIPLAEAGLIIFNHGEAVGRKCNGLLSMSKNGDFYHNASDGYFYLYLDKGYPDNVYKDIEILHNFDLIAVAGGAKNITIDNLSIKYTGAHGIGFGGKNSNITITNCEIGWIGGANQSGSVRYGNGIQFWSATKDVTVKNNWIYQCYDAGLTFQSTEVTDYTNLDFSNNLVEYCAYNFELFAEPGSKIENVSINNNSFRFAGYGWTVQRPDHHSVSCINGWTSVFDITNFSISNNVFDCSAGDLIKWNWKDSTENDGLLITGNAYYQKSNTSKKLAYFGTTGQKVGSNQKDLETAVSGIDKNPSVVKWLS